jgi:3-isopropylmalate dehydrogenase
VVAKGFRTGDIMGPGATLVSTTRMGDEILKELGRLAA